MSEKYFYTTLLQLCSIPKIGSKRIRRLVSHFGVPEKVITAPVGELIKVAGIDLTLAQLIRKGGDTAFAAEQLKVLQQSGAELLSYWDVDYPDLLKQTSDPPVVLYLRGQRAALKNQSIAIVGTRVPSTHGKLMTEKICRELVNSRFTVVSGLARGIDTIAHKTVLQNGGITVAVLGSGVDKIYPEENKSLADKICEQGAVISEFPMGAKADAPHFPRRNRIISGLTLGSVVMEAGEKSGALITAAYALEQNREVYALPGNANNLKALGSNRLIQQGAKLVLSIDDILVELRGQLDIFHKAEKPPTPQLDDLEQTVFNILDSIESKHIDIIAKECKKSTAQILSVLLSLELKGLVKQLAGKNFIQSY